MLFTIGHEANYRKAIKQCKDIDPSAFITKMPGGYVFQSIEDAQAEIERVGQVGNWCIWGLEADWETDVVKSPDGPYHVLLYERLIIDLHRDY